MPTARDPAGTIIDARRALQQGDVATARRLAAAALDRAIAADDAVTAASAALTVAYAGDVPEGDAALASLHDASLRRGDPQAAANALAFRARLAWAQGDPDEAVRLDDEALALARRDGTDLRWIQIAAGVGMMRAGRGELDTANALAQELLATGDPIATGTAEVMMSVADVERGAAADAAERIEPLLPAVRSLGVELFLVPVLLVAARAQLVLGRPERALAHLDEAVAAMWSPVHEQRADGLLLRGMAGWQSSAPRVVEAASAAADELARYLPGPAVLANADALRAVVAAMEGRADDAAARFESAAAGWERASRWILAAEAWTDAATQLKGSDPARAATFLDRARTHAERRGYTVLAARIAAVGSELEAAPPPAAVPPAFAALTPRELEVVLLAAAGRSNQEIGAEIYLSALTVRNYLSTAFAKLGVARRSQLAALLSS